VPEVRQLLEVVLPWERWNAAVAIAWYVNQQRRKAARPGPATQSGGYGNILGHINRRCSTSLVTARFVEHVAQRLLR
jgi:hypothetical protein